MVCLGRSFGAVNKSGWDETTTPPGCSKVIAKALALEIGSFGLIGIISSRSDFVISKTPPSTGFWYLMGSTIQIWYEFVPIKLDIAKLKTIEKPGFPALRLAETQRLAELETLSDTDMASQLRFNMLDQAAPAPSVEAILHAIIPTKFVLLY